MKKKDKVNKPTFMVGQDNKVNKPTLMVEQETPLLCNWSAFSNIFFMLSHLKV